MRETIVTGVRIAQTSTRALRIQVVPPAAAVAPARRPLAATPVSGKLGKLSISTGLHRDGRPGRTTRHDDPPHGLVGTQDTFITVKDHPLELRGGLINSPG
jgi:hypothetical protein